MDDRVGWTSGAVAGSLLAGIVISALMLGKERASGKPSDLIQWERAGAERLGFSPPAGLPGAAEQLGVHAAHMALSAAGGAAYAASFDEDASTIASGVGFGMAFYAACHWLAGPMLRLKPVEWREPPQAIAQHLIVHIVFGLMIAGAARLGARLGRQERFS